MITRIVNTACDWLGAGVALAVALAVATMPVWGILLIVSH
jgi:hypothetical protein